jgi:hypothetical protein
MSSFFSISEDYLPSESGKISLRYVNIFFLYPCYVCFVLEINFFTPFWRGILLKKEVLLVYTSPLKTKKSFPFFSISYLQSEFLHETSLLLLQKNILNLMCKIHDSYILPFIAHLWQYDWYISFRNSQQFNILDVSNTVLKMNFSNHTALAIKPNDLFFLVSWSYGCSVTNYFPYESLKITLLAVFILNFDINNSNSLSIYLFIIWSVPMIPSINVYHHFSSHPIQCLSS